jgi:sugar O-acyltransferase (sialic acid O-acetyltransferase NeuD family)
MKKKLIIIGAGNVGGYLSYNIKDFGHFDILGFLDDDIRKHGKEFYGRTVLGSVADIEAYTTAEQLNVAVTISAPKTKADMIERLSKFPLGFPNFIGKNVWISEKVEIGHGVILYPNVSINYGCKIGDFVIMNMNCAIGHDCTISSYSSLAPGVNLGGHTFLEDGVDVGIGVSTRQNVRLGTFSRIGGQSMVVKNVSAHNLVMGVPGRPVV